MCQEEEGGACVNERVLSRSVNCSNMIDLLSAIDLKSWIACRVCCGEWYVANINRGRGCRHEVGSGMCSVTYRRIDSESASSVQVNSMVLVWRSSGWMFKSLRAGCVGREKDLWSWQTLGPRVQPSQMEAPEICCSAAGRSQMKRSLAGLLASAAGPTSTSLKDSPQTLFVLAAFTRVPVRSWKGLRGPHLGERGRFGRICGEW